MCFGKESADITGYWSKSRHHRGVDRLRHSEAAAARHIRRLLWREPMLRLQRWPRKTFARRRQRQGSIAASPGQLIGRRTTRAALPSRCDARRLESVRDFLVREEPMPSRRLRSARTGGTIAATAQSVVSTHIPLAKSSSRCSSPREDSRRRASQRDSSTTGSNSGHKCRVV